GVVSTSRQSQSRGRRAGRLRAVPRRQAERDPAQGDPLARQRRDAGAAAHEGGDRQAARARPSVRRRRPHPDVPSRVPPAQPRPRVQAHGLGRPQARPPGVRQAQDAVTLADVAFDVPLGHPFSYRVPSDWPLAVGQRVAAPLGRAERIGVVVALRDGDAAGLKPLARVVDPAPVLDAAGVTLAAWIAEQSLSSLGGTLAALLPPPRSTGAQGNQAVRSDDAVPSDEAVQSDKAIPSREPSRTGHPRFKPASPSNTEVSQSPKPDVLIGHGRERRLLERVAAARAPALVIVPDIEAAGRWAQRLDKHGPVARLDSGVDDEARARAWDALAAGDARLAVGTRSALLAPLPAGATLALVDEHEAAHKPPGPPRLHSRDVVGCPECDVALAYARAARTLTCRVCGRETPMPETCPGCRGRRLSPFGWNAERVEHAVRRRFPKARVARYDPDATRGAKGERQ